MANNRLWIVSRATNKKTLLAESSGDGWYFGDNNIDRIDALNEWLAENDPKTDWGAIPSATALYLATDFDMLTESQDRD